MSHTEYHEDASLLSERTKDMHRAIISLQEELEAVDWYQQRADACKDPSLRAILEHNRDEEVEHAAMALEWLRRNHKVFDTQLRTYLFTEGEITAIEEEESDEALGTGSKAAAPGPRNSPDAHGRRSTIGALRSRP